MQEFFIQFRIKDFLRIVLKSHTDYTTDTSHHFNANSSMTLEIL